MKHACRQAETADKQDLATVAAVQAALCYALTAPKQRTTSKAHAKTSQPRMLGTKEINKESTKDPALKELKQLEEGGAKEYAPMDTEGLPREAHLLLRG